MARFQVEAGTGPLGGVVLRDNTSGSWARILPEVGANCVELHLAREYGPLVSVLFPPDSVQVLKERPARHGIPILFPFPNRIRDGSFTFGGITTKLPTNQSGHAIHGLVIDQPFTEVGRRTDKAAAVTLAIDSQSNPRSAAYPFPFRLELEYALDEWGMSLTATATNTGAAAMPFGYGIHPYFNVPLGPEGSRAECTISAPAAFGWELDEHLIPTGRHVPLTDETTLMTPTKLGERSFDNVYGMTPIRDGWTICALTDAASRARLEVLSDDQFRDLVVYGPPALPAVCFEPYTCTTDAFNLSTQGVDSGTRILEPGKTWSGTIRFQVHGLPA